jgi:hypothetical protein
MYGKLNNLSCQGFIPYIYLLRLGLTNADFDAFYTFGTAYKYNFPFEPTPRLSMGYMAL